MRTLVLLFSSCLSLVTNAADWSCWRGPDGLGVSVEKNLPVQWTKEKNVVWKQAIPGRGVSSPCVTGNRVYLTAQMPDTGLHVLAIDRDRGGIIWDRQVGQGKLRSNNLHNMATPTAVAEGGLIWVLFGTGDLACLDEKGTVIWRRNLVKEYGEYKTNHGYGTSPMLLDGRLYIACMHQGSSYFLAVDAKTGKNLWKKDRNLEPKDEAQDSYSSPIFLRENGGTQIVLAGAESVNAYEPLSGDQLWISGGLRVPHPYGRTISGPTAGEGMVVVVASGFQNRGYTVGVKTGGRGDITQTHRAWSCNKFSADCSTPLIYEGSLYFIRDDGMASCLNPKTGEPHWQERLFAANVKVSPVAGDGKVYFLSGQGNCVVLKASPKMEILATNSLEEATLSTPAISNGKLFIRSEQNLYCVSP